jgi:hypothetical protein
LSYTIFIENGTRRALTTAIDDLRQDFDTLSSDEEVSEPGHRSLDTSHEEQTVPSLERYLAREWTEHPSCSRQSHKEDHEELAKNKCHRSCDSLNDVAARLDGLIGDENNRHPLPNVMDPSFDLLSHTQHTEPANNEGTSRNSPPLNNVCGHDYREACQIALEGAPDGGAPPSLCLSKRHSIENPLAEDFLQRTYDVDSICSFPSSLAVAKFGIQWYPQPYAIFNHTDNVHFSIDIPNNSFTRLGTCSRGSSPHRQPLHHVPNYCFGRVQGLTDTFIWIFFPALYMQTSQEDPLKRTCVARDQYSCWYDHVLFPAIAAAVRDPNILQYIPKNLNIAQTNSRARQEGISTERLSDMNAEFGILGQGSRSTSLSYVLQNRHLEAIWEGVRTRAATYPQFAGIKLYLGAKNLKLVYMNTDIRQTIRAWRSQWQNAVDRAFLDPSDTYVDIGRQYTPRIGSVAEANVLMWRRCCLKQLWRQRQAWSSQYNAMYPFVRSSLEDIATSKSQSVPLRLIEYPRFTLRDTIDMTIQPADKSREVGEGLIYSQFYNLVKIPFDAAKQYPFQNRQLEKMALDPSYVADYERSTRGSHANQASLSLAYRLSKLRVRASLVQDDEGSVSVPFSYGVRAEDRVSVKLLDLILSHIDSLESMRQSDPIPVCQDQEPPFFAIPSTTMTRFLHGTVNKYCFLFEYIKSQAGARYSLPETVVMTLALRSLRFVTSGIIAKESILWKDRWKQAKQVASRSGQRQSSEIEREGLGLYRTSKDYGLGWWLPGKFNWDEWRFRGEVNERLVAGNSLLHIEYGRQWKVIKDIRDVHARMWQANKWVKQYSVRKSRRNRNIWFEYLSNTVIELFQSEVWRAARKSLDWKSSSDLTDEAAASYPADQPPPYCYDALASSFHDRRRNVNHTRPYFLTGNKIRSSSVWDLVCDHLGFNLHDGRLESRDGLQPLHHRIAV